jgi:hypothetical protein
MSLIRWFILAGVSCGIVPVIAAHPGAVKNSRYAKF